MSRAQSTIGPSGRKGNGHRANAGDKRGSWPPPLDCGTVPASHSARSNVGRHQTGDLRTYIRRMNSSHSRRRRLTWRCALVANVAVSALVAACSEDARHANPADSLKPSARLSRDASVGCVQTRGQRPDTSIEIGDTARRSEWRPVDRRFDGREQLRQSEAANHRDV